MVLLLALPLGACDRNGRAELERGQKLVTNEPRKALETYSRAEEKGAGSAEVKKGKAAAHENLGQNDEAAALLRAVLEQDPDDFEAHLGLARLALRARRLEEARKHLERTLEKSPPHVPSLLLFAALADTKERAERGLKAFRALEGKTYAKFRGSAEYVVARAALDSAARTAGGAKEELLDEQGAHRPFNLQVALALADSLQVAGRDFLAEWLLKRASEVPSAEEAVHEALAKLALRLRHPTTAEKAIERLSQGFKRDPQILLLQAQLSELNNDAPKSARLTGRALSAVPQGDEKRRRGVALVHARSLLKSGHSARARKILAEVIEKQPDHAPARLVLAAAQIKEGLLEKAAETTGPLADDPTFGVAASSLVVRAHLANQDEKAALAVADRALAQHRDNPEALLLAYETYLAVDRKKKALQVLESATKEQRKSPAIQAKHLALTAEVRGFTAAESLAKNLLAKGAPSEVQRQLARLYAKEKRFPEAEAIYRKLSQSDPTRLEGLAALQRQQGRLGEAIASLQQFVAAVPHDTAGWLRLGLLQAEAGDVAGAARAYERLLSIEPNSPVALNNLALILADEDESRDRAARLARRAMASAPDNPAIVDTLGWVLVRRGRKEELTEARDLLLRSSQALGTAESRYHYGVALLAADQPEPARDVLRESIAKAKKDAEWLPEARRRWSAAKRRAAKGQASKD